MGKSPSTETQRSPSRDAFGCVPNWDPLVNDSGIQAEMARSILIPAAAWLTR